MNPSELYEAGKLSEAILAAQQLVKSHPVETEPRLLLSQLLLFAGDFERADKQLEIVFLQAPDLAVGVTLLRQLVRGEVARQQFFSEGRAPSLLVSDDPTIEMHLAAAVAVREGRHSAAVALLAQAQEQRPPVSGRCNDTPFDDVRDLDDLLGPVLEVVTASGKYYWINVSTICSLEFQKPVHLQDLVWRSATASVRNGPEGDIYFPALYAGSHTQDDELLKLGRKTEWSSQEPIRGLGHRMWLVGDEAVPLLEVQQLTIDQVS